MKEDYLRFEREFLSPYAMQSVNTQGRAEKQEPCPLRTEFQRDRDRIIHSKAFRRLKHKTQVFITPSGDHYRTRLTHTLEVTQIARTISRALMLNEDLTEAIALGHDLGHTPFGHAGERVLQKKVGHFEHNEQSLRVVEVLENLNLTHEVKNGILNHRSSLTPSTLEGMVVNISDKIAYLTHDIEDAIRAGVLDENKLPSILEDIIGKGKGNKINRLVNDIINNSYGKNLVAFSTEMNAAVKELRKFMFEEVYCSPKAKREEKRAEGLLNSLFDYFKNNQSEVPSIYATFSEDLNTQITDYIASMSDTYAIALFEHYFIPRNKDLY
jgi:dGTPase